jgi:hypothetical protein
MALELRRLAARVRQPQTHRAVLGGCGSLETPATPKHVQPPQERGSIGVSTAATRTPAFRKAEQGVTCLPEAMSCPEGANSTCVTASRWPRNRKARSWGLKLHSISDPSTAARHAHACTNLLVSLECQSLLGKHSPQPCIAESPEPETSCFRGCPAANATLVTCRESGYEDRFFFWGGGGGKIIVRSDY